MEEPWMHITEWKKPIWKDVILNDSNDMKYASGKCKTIEAGKNFIVASISWAQRIFKVANYSVGYYNGGCTSLCVCPNP